MSLLAHKDMLAEHPREDVYLEAIMKMKPYWKAGPSYDWAEVKKGSRLSADTIKRSKRVEKLDFGNKYTVDDSENRPEGVSVNEYHDEDDMDIDENENENEGRGKGKSQDKGKKCRVRARDEGTAIN
ncbi:hypothetical protein C0992_003901 [Termitomyces sp. T32_za158]|nr:hypothetical protein C0992_003901 [Termitomyces sp. T32_za158]